MRDDTPKQENDMMLYFMRPLLVTVYIYAFP